MAEAANAPGPRAALQRRYTALRDPGGATGGLTLRAARFAARQRGCALDLARLAAMPAWQADAARDRGRLAAAIGLLAARDTLARAIDGAQLRVLAECFGEDLLDGVLAHPPLAEPRVPAPDTLDPARLRLAGERLMIAAGDPAQVAARRVCALAGDVLDACAG